MDVRFLNSGKLSGDEGLQTVVLSVTSHQLHSNMAPAQTASTYGRVNLLTKSLQCYSHYRCHTDVKLSDDTLPSQGQSNYVTILALY
jgi:hypothetical protein